MDARLLPDSAGGLLQQRYAHNAGAGAIDVEIVHNGGHLLMGEAYARLKKIGRNY
jgi:hypothetical protein